MSGNFQDHFGGGHDFTHNGQRSSYSNSNSNFLDSIIQQDIIKQQDRSPGGPESYSSNYSGSPTPPMSQPYAALHIDTTYFASQPINSQQSTSSPEQHTRYPQPIAGATGSSFNYAPEMNGLTHGHMPNMSLNGNMNRQSRLDLPGQPLQPWMDF